MKLFSHFRKVLDASAAGRHKHRRILRLLLVLLPNLAIAIPVTASTVAPAPPATIFNVPVIFNLDLRVPGTLCAGSAYFVTVLVHADYQIPVGGTTVQASDAVVPGIVINASSDSPGVATISPQRMVSSISSVGNVIGAVTFALHAIKAGDDERHVSWRHPIPVNPRQPRPDGQRLGASG